MNFVLWSRFNSAYEFDNLSERQCMWEAGSATTAAATPEVSVAAPGTATQSRYGLRSGTGFQTLHGFLASRQGSARGPVMLPANQDNLVSRQRDPGTYVDET